MTKIVTFIIEFVISPIGDIFKMFELYSQFVT